MDIHSPLKAISPVDASQINAAIWHWNTAAPPVGAAYVLWARVYGIDALMAAAQSIQETGWYREHTTTRNPAGMKGDGPYFVYSSWRDGIEAHCKLLAQYADPNTWYYQEGMRRTGEAGTLRSMAHVWAPPQYQPSGMTGGDAYAQDVVNLARQIAAQPAPPVPGIEQHWAGDYLSAAMYEGIIQGMPDGNVRPDWSMTRAELATILDRAITTPVPQYAAPPADVPTSHWAYRYISRAVGEGWMTERYPGIFAPELPASREDVASALVAAEAPALISRAYPGFPDTSSPVIKAAYEAGWISGYPDKRMRPGDPVTRAEMTAMMARAYGWVATGYGIGSIGAISAEYQEAGWYEQGRIWVPLRVADLWYGDDKLLTTAYQVEPVGKISQPQWYQEPILLAGIAAIAIGTVLVLTDRRGR